MVKIFRKLVILVLIIIVVAIVIFLVYNYWTKTVNVEFKEVASLHTNEELPGTWWSTVFSENHSVERKYGIKLPNVNFKKKCLIITGGRELKQLTYVRKSKFVLPYKDHPYIGDAILKSKLYPKTIFVYEINRINLIYDDISWPNVKIEK